jgi:hypothetical protein
MTAVNTASPAAIELSRQMLRALQGGSALPGRAFGWCFAHGPEWPWYVKSRRQYGVASGD